MICAALEHALRDESVLPLLAQAVDVVDNDVRRRSAPAVAGAQELRILGATDIVAL
jgi:hypothetical protein